jgi:hypothetical protein
MLVTPFTHVQMQTGDSGVISRGVIGKRGLGGREEFFSVLLTERGDWDWEGAVMSVGAGEVG